jgi:hypothetical protein
VTAGCRAEFVGATELVDDRLADPLHRRVGDLVVDNDRVASRAAGSPGITVKRTRATPGRTTHTPDRNPVDYSAAGVAYLDGSFCG